MTGRQVPLRSLVAIVLIPVMLAVTVVAGAARERRELPRALEELRLVDQRAGAFLSCFQGVNDELFLPGRTADPTARMIAAASTRLAGCELDVLKAGLDAVELSPAAPVGPARMRRAREAILAAIQAWRRVVLDGRAAVAAMDRSLRTGGDASIIAIGYRAAQAGAETAESHLREAERQLAPPVSAAPLVAR